VPSSIHDDQISAVDLAVGYLQLLVFDLEEQLGTGHILTVKVSEVLGGENSVDGRLKERNHLKTCMSRQTRENRFWDVLGKAAKRNAAVLLAIESEMDAIKSHFGSELSRIIEAVDKGIICAKDLISSAAESVATNLSLPQKPTTSLGAEASFAQAPAPL